MPSEGSDIDVCQMRGQTFPVSEPTDETHACELVTRTEGRCPLGLSVYLYGCFVFDIYNKAERTMNGGIRPWQPEVCDHGGLKIIKL